MTEKRRTRATGFSPGGPQELDINAPTRRSRKAKIPAAAAPEDAPAPATSTIRARSGAKRKIEDDIADEPAAKKSRPHNPIEKPEAIASGSQALATLPDSESEFLPGSKSSSQEEGTAQESEQLIEPRVNAQQPTPPLDTPSDASTVRPTTKAAPAPLQEDISLADAQRQADRKMKNEKRISDMIRTYHTTLPGREEVAKALSECDDDEWAERYSTVMEEARNPTPFIETSKGDFEKWVPGSTAMFVVRKPNKKDIAAAKKSGPCMPRSVFIPGFFTTASRLAAMGARPLTDINTIVAVSASLDWYEKNPSIVAPTATEMTAMLDNFARAKQAEQTDAVNTVTTQNLQKPTCDAPLTPKAQVTSKNLAEAPHASESDDGHMNIDDQEEAGMEQYGDLTADVHQDEVEATEPQTPQQQDGPQGPRTWSSVLSANAIGIFTPLNNWFSRRNRDRRNVTATEPRPVRAEPRVTRPARSHRKPRSREIPTQFSKTLPEKNDLLCDLKAAVAPDSPTPAAPQPRRGRPDSHLPVHLRGVLFEDLPAEWQAVSEHLKKPQQAQMEDEDDEPVDMEYLLTTAKRTRKERERKELQEQAELIAQKQRDLESDDEFPGDQVDRKGKKRVTFSPQKAYSAKLGHSTFGMPASIDEISSEEEPEDLGPQTHFGRSSRRSRRPMKSCLKRPYQQPTCDDYNEDDDQDGYDPRPAKKARLDEFASSQSSDMLEDIDDIYPCGEGCESFLYDDDPRRARPFSRFISKPPSELRTAEKAQLEFERLNPRNRSQAFNSQLNKKPSIDKDESNHRPVFGRREGSPILDWSKGFRTPGVMEAAARIGRFIKMPLPYDRLRILPELTEKDENGRSVRRPNSKRNAQLARIKELREGRVRLNRQREDAMKRKLKITSSWRTLVLDQAVLESVALLDDDDIVAEGFGKYPDHAEATISEAASKAMGKNLEWVPGTCLDLTSEEREAVREQNCLEPEAEKKTEVAERAEAAEAAKAAQMAEVEEEL